MQDVIDLLDVAAKSYPLKALAPDIGKAESTLRNELTQQEGYKLGLVTTYQILKHTKDYRALDRLEKLLGRVAFTLPDASPTDMPTLMQMVGATAKEFGEHMACMGVAMADGKIDNTEVKQCLKELHDALVSLVRLKAYLDELRGR
jgi:hypothetical protein